MTRTVTAYVGLVSGPLPKMAEVRVWICAEGTARAARHLTFVSLAAEDVDHEGGVLKPSCAVKVLDEMRREGDLSAEEMEALAEIVGTEIDGEREAIGMLVQYFMGDAA
jgi:hypothetical protein